jgi:hypothetical protein
LTSSGSLRKCNDPIDTVYSIGDDLKNYQPQISVGRVAEFIENNGIVD